MVRLRVPVSIHHVGTGSGIRISHKVMTLRHKPVVFYLRKGSRPSDAMFGGFVPGSAPVRTSCRTGLLGKIVMLRNATGRIRGSNAMGSITFGTVPCSA